MRHRILISTAVATVACAAVVATAFAAPKARVFQYSGEVLGASYLDLDLRR